MAMNVLDEEGLPPAGVEPRLAKHILSRPNPLAKKVVYALVGAPRRNAELARLTGGKADNNLTAVLKFLKAEGLIGTVYDLQTRPAATAYVLTSTGLLVADWMRRYEWFDDLQHGHPEPATA